MRYLSFWQISRAFSISLCFGFLSMDPLSQGDLWICRTFVLQRPLRSLRFFHCTFVAVPWLCDRIDHRRIQFYDSLPWSPSEALWSLMDKQFPCPLWVHNNQRTHSWRGRRPIYILWIRVICSSQPLPVKSGIAANLIYLIGLRSRVWCSFLPSKDCKMRFRCDYQCFEYWLEIPYYPAESSQFLACKTPHKTCLSTIPDVFSQSCFSSISGSVAGSSSTSGCPLLLPPLRRWWLEPLPMTVHAKSSRRVCSCSLPGRGSRLGIERSWTAFNFGWAPSAGVLTRAF